MLPTSRIYHSQSLSQILLPISYGLDASLTLLTCESLALLCGYLLKVNKSCTRCFRNPIGKHMLGMMTAQNQSSTTTLRQGQYSHRETIASSLPLPHLLLNISLSIPMLKTILSLKGGKEGKDKLTSQRIDLLRAPFHAKDLPKKKLTLD